MDKVKGEEEVVRRTRISCWYINFNEVHCFCLGMKVEEGNNKAFVKHGA